MTAGMVAGSRTIHVIEAETLIIFKHYSNACLKNLYLRGCRTWLHVALDCTSHKAEEHS